MEGLEQIKVCAPTPGTCRACATMHDPLKPHDKNSLYYQNWYYRRHKRLPTWEDAAAHCDEETRAAFMAERARRGGTEDAAADEGRRLDGD